MRPTPINPRTITPTNNKSPQSSRVGSCSAATRRTSRDPKTIAIPSERIPDARNATEGRPKRAPTTPRLPAIAAASNMVGIVGKFLVEAITNWISARQQPRTRV